MRRQIAAIILAIFVACSASAQHAQVKGKIMDTLEKKPLALAVISLISKKDSTLYSFTRSQQNGSFVLPALAPGKYGLLVSYPKFTDYQDELEVKEAQVLDLGKIPLTLKAMLLKEVVIRSGQAIRIKGDTTEFVADSFALKEGATVEDLLQKLPGIQVNAKGEITAQGKQVDKVLVDGEEFFGDDPTIATRNLSGRAVDKVQVYDTKTEQQQLTGITTGREGKTINIKLKEDKKKGAFGKVTAATDFSNYDDSRALYNRFVGKKKVSVYGSKSTLNSGSLDYNDQRKLGIESNYEYNELTGFYSSIGGGDDFRSSGGLPDAYTAGGLFGNKWKDDRQSLNGSYRFNRLATNGGSTGVSTNFLDSTHALINHYTSQNYNLRQQHAADAKYEWKIDSLASLKLIATGSYRTSHRENGNNSSTQNEKGEMVNENETRSDNNSSQLNSDNQLSYKQLFKKKNRQLLMSLRFTRVQDEQDGTNYALARFNRNGVWTDSTTDQQKNFNGHSQTISTRVTYNEPLSKKWNMVLDYSFTQNNASSDKKTYNLDGNGKYEALDQRYSNNFDLKASAQSATALMVFKDKKWSMNFGSGVTSIRLNLHNITSNTHTSYPYTRLTPQAIVSYNFKQQTGIQFNYRGSSRQPSINQLQPLQENTDGLNLYIGNPDLKVGFNHDFNAYYYNYKVLTGTNIWAYVTYNMTNNDITTYRIYDLKTGKSIFTPVNVNGNNYWNFYGNWSTGGGVKKWRHSVQLNGNGGHNISLTATKDMNGVVQDQRGVNTNANFDFNYGIGYEVTDKYRVNLRPQVGYRSSRSSLRSTPGNNYYTYGGGLDGYLKLPWKLEVSSNVNADLRQRIPGFTQRLNRVIWNASLTRKVLKKDAGKIILSGNDLLNQNNGYSQSISGNYSSESRNLQISRYFLLRFEWNFNKMAGGK